MFPGDSAGKFGNGSVASAEDVMKKWTADLNLSTIPDDVLLEELKLPARADVLWRAIQARRNAQRKQRKGWPLGKPRKPATQ
jgi:hypothetical protein